MSTSAEPTHPDHLELRARRLIAQGLAPTGARAQLRTPLDVARHLLALQGQNYQAGIAALAVRAGVDVAAVLAAVDTRELIRTWPQRGTLHFMAAEDARWMMRLCNPRVARAQEQRRPQLGIGPDAFAAAREAFHGKLLEPADEPLTRRGAYAVFAAAGVDPADGRGSHLLRAFGGEGDVVQGPKLGTEETFLHVNHLPVLQRELSGDEALAELGSRYFHAHGPARVKDLAWWSGLSQTEAKRARQLSRDVTEIELAGETFVMGAWQEQVTGEELQAALERDYILPAFDEYLLGYGTRAEIVAPEIAPEVLSKNGLSWPFHVSSGAITGRAT
ncbi:DNA glycosylase AlkZ-like family protein [Corynebacterium halotolerans]|uniref:DNA glycosylase AlkZ-like family protein n=1 Tax=Corynebacterium halotolerans TaxID=225326 RepID=UPI003CE9C429